MAFIWIILQKIFDALQTLIIMQKHQFERVHMKIKVTKIKNKNGVVQTNFEDFSLFWLSFFSTFLRTNISPRSAPNEVIMEDWLEIKKGAVFEKDWEGGNISHPIQFPLYKNYTLKDWLFSLWIWMRNRVSSLKTLSRIKRLLLR